MTYMVDMSGGWRVVIDVLIFVIPVALAIYGDTLRREAGLASVPSHINIVGNVIYDTE